MNFLNKNPIIRLTFLITYLATAVWIIIKDFAWLNILVALLMLFGCYIALVKSGVIKDTNADSINNFYFDFLSIVIAAILLIDIILKAL
jgi:hypothetical protein